MNHIVNLTPHPLNLKTADGSTLEIAPSGVVARVAESREALGTLAVLGISRASYGEIEGLPDAAPDTIYIVSALVLARTTRPDVFAPGPAIRDGSGKIIGADGLSASTGYVMPPPPPSGWHHPHASRGEAAPGYTPRVHPVEHRGESAPPFSAPDFEGECFLTGDKSVAVIRQGRNWNGATLSSPQEAAAVARRFYGESVEVHFVSAARAAEYEEYQEASAAATRAAAEAEAFAGCTHVIALQVSPTQSPLQRGWGGLDEVHMSVKEALRTSLYFRDGRIEVMRHRNIGVQYGAYRGPWTGRLFAEDGTTHEDFVGYLHFKHEAGVVMELELRVRPEYAGSIAFYEGSTHVRVRPDGDERVVACW